MADFHLYLDRVKELNAGTIIREAGMDEGAAFVNLFNTYYKRKTSLEYYKWQFFDSPFESRLFIAVHKDRLAGMYGIKLFPLTGDLWTGFAVDFLIDEPYRKKGIAFLLENEVVNFCRQQGVTVLSALPNASGNAAFKALGWKSVAKVDTLVKEMPARAGLSPTSTIPSAPVGSTDTGARAFLKNAIYRKWRYDLHPAYRYERIGLDEDRFAMIKTFSNPFDGKTYCDIVETGGRYCLEELEELLEKIMGRAKEEKISDLTIWALPHTPLYAFLMELGFAATPQERYFCLKLIDLEQVSLYNIENWSLAEIDAEIF